MQLSEQLLHTTIRIEASLASGGCSVGTGFFFKFCDDGKTYVPAIVTNRHVVCLLYTSPSPRDVEESRMPSSA